MISLELESRTISTVEEADEGKAGKDRKLLGALKRWPGTRYALELALLRPSLACVLQQMALAFLILLEFQREGPTPESWPVVFVCMQEGHF